MGDRSATLKFCQLIEINQAYKQKEKHKPTQLLQNEIFFRYLISKKGHILVESSYFLVCIYIDSLQCVCNRSKLPYLGPILPHICMFSPTNPYFGASRH